MDENGCEYNVAQPRVKLCNTDYNDEKIVEEKRRRGVQGISTVGLSQLGSQHSGDAAATLASKGICNITICLDGSSLEKRETVSNGKLLLVLLVVEEFLHSLSDLR
ncbi:hypothetical protein K7X08_034241 [Anisodus acutangulus]|uniref:Uncharacterized protein n=1 Tax=Anisodus acutangulus TaxID=402998 RepID=A0A9Q1LGL2_9SOLA|nr:hypothetical protein K7X08_034241 [Anisodus acutangulus]